MGCLFSLLELNFFQSDYNRIPDEIYNKPYNENNYKIIEIKNNENLECNNVIKSSKVGDLLQSYVLLEKLGQGSYSTVKLGLEIGTNRQVAVKIINKKKLGKGVNYDRLVSEVNILSSVSHKNIIQFYDVYDESPYYYLVTEFVQGGELFDCIVKRTYYTEKSARKLISQILQALNYLHHEVGIVHRDIKPENILLTTDDDNGIIKLADFGFATYVSNLSSDEISVGTPAYVAPEIIRGDKYGTEVDIWSLGVVCYILLCGCPPFQDESSGIFDQIQSGSYDFHEEHWSHVSPSAVDFISHMLTINQKERWTAQQLLVHPWMQLSFHSHSTPSLDICLNHLKRYTARKKLKALAQVVIMTNRMKKFMFSNSDGGAIQQYQEKERKLSHDLTNEYKYHIDGEHLEKLNEESGE